MAINIIAAGTTATLASAWFNLGGQTPGLEGAARFQGLTWPFADAISQVPLIGPVYTRMLSGHNVLVYQCLALQSPLLTNQMHLQQEEIINTLQLQLEFPSQQSFYQYSYFYRLC